MAVVEVPVRGNTQMAVKFEYGANIPPHWREECADRDLCGRRKLI